MSKLNDSTLKILKKYRLDTDMSVFGNENKLYDVVKVMDDMVGNQVSKYVGNCNYFSSTSTENYSCFYVTSKGKSTTASYSEDLPKPTEKRIYFDPFTLKFLGVVAPNSNTLPVCQVLKNQNLIGYFVFNLDDKLVLFYEDFELNSPTKFSVNKGDIIEVRSMLIFSNEKYIHDYTPISMTSFFEFTTSSNNSIVPKSIRGNISIPEQITMLDTSKPIYCSSAGYLRTLSSSFTINTSYEISLVEV